MFPMPLGDSPKTCCVTPIKHMGLNQISHFPTFWNNSYELCCIKLKEKQTYFLKKVTVSQNSLNLEKLKK